VIHRGDDGGEAGAGGRPSVLARRPRRPFLLAVLLPFLAFCRPSAPAAERLRPPAAPERQPVTVARSADEPFLDELEHQTFAWFWDLADPVTGLTPDRAPTPSFSSIAAVGFGLTAYAIGAERGWVTRADAAARVAKTLRFFVSAPSGEGRAGTTGYRGFYYHFIDMHTGLRFREIELSTIDSALLAAGALTCESYFDRDDPVETEIRHLAETLYDRMDWNWASPRPPGVSMGWTPEEGFHELNWHGYDESMILYVLALGSTTHPADPSAWTEWTSTYEWGEYYGQTHVNFSPLFGHQYSHVWIDFRGIQDAYMRDRGIDYFENSRRAVLSQRAYAIANPAGFDGYGPDVWGLTACDGPLDGRVSIGGTTRTFQGYSARGASLLHVIDDGTLAPTAAAGSIPFAPEIAVPALRAMSRLWGGRLRNRYGFLDAFNPTLRDPAVHPQSGTVVAGIGWFDVDQLGIDQGPIVAMIENARSELIWRTLKKNPHIVAGLRKAGFTGGWLERASP
jgi:hypothetical protein